MGRRFRGEPFALWLTCAVLAMSSPGAFAQAEPKGTAASVEADAGKPEQSSDQPAQEEGPKKAPSPWMLLPTFSNNPKLGTSVGAMAGYITKFDPQSQVSIFGVSAQYTSTDSATVALFARTSFAGDQHRLKVGALGGRIKNDYDDFLGSGQPLKSEDNIRSIFARYLYRVRDDWFVGVQALATNYQIVGQTSLDDDKLDLLGLSGFESSGAGLVVQHDSRDSLDSPKKGWLLNLNGVAYREDDEFEVYRLDYRHFWSHGEGHVFALRQSNQWTYDAPPSAYAPVRLRGYTSGEYLGKSMSSIEVEERHRFAERWTATLFAGVACLYGAERERLLGVGQPLPHRGRGRAVPAQAGPGHRGQPGGGGGKGRQQGAALPDGIRLVVEETHLSGEPVAASVRPPFRTRLAWRISEESAQLMSASGSASIPRGRPIPCAGVLVTRNVDFGSLDEPVCAQPQCCRHGDAERACRLQVQHDLESLRPLDRYLGRVCAAEDALDHLERPFRPGLQTLLRSRRSSAVRRWSPRSRPESRTGCGAADRSQRWSGAWGTRMRWPLAALARPMHVLRPARRRCPLGCAHRRNGFRTRTSSRRPAASMSHRSDPRRASL